MTWPAYQQPIKYHHWVKVLTLSPPKNLTSEVMCQHVHIIFLCFFSRLTFAVASLSKWVLLRSNFLLCCPGQEELFWWTEIRDTGAATTRASSIQSILNNIFRKYQHTMKVNEGTPTFAGKGCTKCILQNRLHQKCFRVCIWNYFFVMASSWNNKPLKIGWVTSQRMHLK